MRAKKFLENIYRTVCPKLTIKNPLRGVGDIGGEGYVWASPPFVRIYYLMFASCFSSFFIRLAVSPFQVPAFARK